MSSLKVSDNNVDNHESYKASPFDQTNHENERKEQDHEKSFSNNYNSIAATSTMMTSVVSEKARVYRQYRELLSQKHFLKKDANPKHHSFSL